MAHDLIRYWIEFPNADAHGCRLPNRCGVSAWSEADALQIVADHYCARGEAPRPSSLAANFDVSTLDDDPSVRPTVGVSVWRGVWYPFITTS